MEGELRPLGRVGSRDVDPDHFVLARASAIGAARGGGEVSRLLGRADETAVVRDEGRAVIQYSIAEAEEIRTRGFVCKPEALQRRTVGRSAVRPGLGQSFGLGEVESFGQIL